MCKRFWTYFIMQRTDAAAPLHADDLHIEPQSYSFVGTEGHFSTDLYAVNAPREGHSPNQLRHRRFMWSSARVLFVLLFISLIPTLFWTNIEIHQYVCGGNGFVCCFDQRPQLFTMQKLFDDWEWELELNYNARLEKKNALSTTDMILNHVLYFGHHYLLL